MRPLRSLMFGMVMVAAGATAHAQDGAVHVVTYVDVMPSSVAAGATLLKQYRDASRKEDGSVNVQVLQEIGRPNRLAIVEVWKDKPARDAHVGAASTAQFRDKLKAIQNAPYDERVHFPLSVGPLPASLGGPAIIGVTHVDVIPPQRENGTALVKQLADDGRKDDGNLRFEAVTQTGRQNHFTVIEAWRNRKSSDAHAMNAKTRAFREKLAPASGALYDQRFYKLLD